MAIKEMSKPEFTVLILPGERTKISWEPPSGMPEEQWLAAGLQLYEAEGAIQWWLGDWWIYGERAYGDRKALFNEGGPFEGRNFQTVMNYGWVANSVTTSVRTEVLSFQHHLFVASLPPVQQKKWLSRAVKESWSSNQLKAAIAAAAAVGRTAAVEFAAERLGKFPVLYADPPWRYEN